MPLAPLFAGEHEATWRDWPIVATLGGFCLFWLLCGWAIPRVWAWVLGAWYGRGLPSGSARARVRRVARGLVDRAIRSHEPLPYSVATVAVGVRGTARLVLRSASLAFLGPLVLVRILWNKRRPMRTAGNACARLRGLLIGGQLAHELEEIMTWLVEAWREGVPKSVLAAQLEQLSAIVDVLGHGTGSNAKLVLRARILQASMTYLFGDPVAGGRLAEECESQAREVDAASPHLPHAGRPQPEFAWLANYPSANALVFQGDFRGGIDRLWARWSADFAPLDQRDRITMRSLFDAGSRATLLDPIAAVPRHILLAAALGGPEALPTPWPNPTAPGAPLGDLTRLGRDWYAAGLRLCRSRADDGISLHFTHAYAGLYHDHVAPLVAEREGHPLGRIPESAPPVSRYARYALGGLSKAIKALALSGGPGAVPDATAAACRGALRDLRRAYAHSSQSGTRFLDGLLLPIQAAVAALARRSGVPDLEAQDLLRRAQQHAEKAKNTLFWELVYGAAVIVASQSHDAATHREASQQLRDCVQPSRWVLGVMRWLPVGRYLAPPSER